MPWLWAHPRWFEWRTWGDQVREDRDIVLGAVATWWRSPRRLASAWHTGLHHARHFFGLDEPKTRTSHDEELVEISREPSDSTP